MCPGTQYSESLGRHFSSNRDFKNYLRQSQDTERPIQPYDPVKKLDKDAVRQRRAQHAANKALQKNVAIDRPLDGTPRERVAAAEKHAAQLVKR